MRHGGVSTSVRELCWGLARIGVEVHVCTTLRGYDQTTDGPADDRLRSAGVKIQYFQVHPWKQPGQRYAYSPALGTFLREAIPRVDLVHIHGLWQYPTFVAGRVCRSSRIPYLLSPCGALDPYGWHAHRSFKWFYGFFFERRTFEGAVAIHFTSTMEQRQAWIFGVNRPHVVIPRSIRMDAVPELPSGIFRSQHPEIGRQPILLFLGRLHPIKRLDLLVNAFMLVARRYGNVHLVIAGPDDGAGSNVRKTLSQARLSDRVTFTGLLAGPDKWAAFRDSSLFLLPSDHESFGMVALEAMAVGLPVIVSPHVALADWIAKVQAGQVIDQDPAAWAAAMEHLLNNPAAGQVMGEAGRRLVATEFSSERIAGAMKEIYWAVVRGTLKTSSDV